LSETARKVRPPTADESDSDFTSLGREGENEWGRLRRQLDLANRFWLGFLFSADPRVARALRRRTSGVLRSQAMKLLEFRPETPEALRSAVAEVFQRPTDVVGCVWVEALQTDRAAHQGPGAWSAAWQDLFLRLNERRERLRRHLPCGLVLAMAAGLKDAARRAAPDLWSIRGLVLEPPPLPIADAAPATRLTTAVLPAEGVAPVPGVLAPLGARELPSQGGEPLELLRRAEGFLLRDEARQAMSAAANAVEQLGRCHPLSAQALATLARAEAADGDWAAAIEHLQTALGLRADEPKRSDLHLYGLWVELAQNRLRDLEQARSAAAGALELSRVLVERNGESPESLRDLSVSLNKVGEVLLRSGDLAPARRSYEESLEIRRRLLDVYGESP
jgi:tetratricopeptide (TPR) repeat protein